jgi:DNA-binding NarL/FixJ family response regulator
MNAMNETHENELRDAAAEFIESHRRTEAAISKAASAGMTGEVIARVSGLSPETVDAFLRQLVNAPKPE